MKLHQRKKIFSEFHISMAMFSWQPLVTTSCNGMEICNIQILKMSPFLKGSVENSVLLKLENSEEKDQETSIGFVQQNFFIL